MENEFIKNNPWAGLVKNNPWAGLASYKDEEIIQHNGQNSKLFCGREEEIHDVTQLINNNIVVTLYGKSGIGKTSLLNAGVFPCLRKKHYLPLNIRLSKDAANKSFQKCIIDEIEKAIGVKEGNTQTFEVVPMPENELEPNYLWSYFARTRFFVKSEDSQMQQVVFPVIVLDQFEEALRDHKDKAEALLRQIAYLLDESHALSSRKVDDVLYKYDFNFRFVISIREDNLFQLEDSIDNCYLSSLKRCRYRLRALSKQGARDVILIPGKDCIEESEKNAIADRIIRLADPNKKGVIDTLLLSLICFKTYLQKKGQYITLSDLDYWGDGNNLLEKYYEEATSGLSNSQKRILQSFVDAMGSRKRKKAKDIEEQLGSKEFNKLISGDNMLLTVDESTETVELIHDMLCPVIQQSKEELVKKKNDIILSLLLGVLACFGVYSLHTCIVGYIVDKSFFGPINGNDVEKISSSLSVFYFALCSFFVLAPPVIVSLVYQFKTSRWLVTILTAIILVPTIINYDTIGVPEKTIACFMALACMIGFFLAFRNQDFKKTGNPVIAIWNALPLKLYYFIMLGYLFTETVFGTIIGTIRSCCEQIDSCWGLFVLPVFFIHITNCILKRNKRFDSFSKWYVVLFLVILVVNALLSRVIPMAVVIILLLGYIFCLWSLYDGVRAHQRIAVVLCNLLLVVSVFVANLGFDPIHIKYASVKHVLPCSWSTVFAQNNNEMVCVLDAKTGDTIVPSVLQLDKKISNINYFCYYSCKKDETNYSEPFLGAKNKNDTVYLPTAMISSVFIDRSIRSSGKTGNEKKYDNLTHEVFKELRKAFIINSSVGSPLDVNKLSQLKKLTELQNNKYNTCYQNIQRKNNKLTEADINSFIVNLTRNLYLLQLNEVLLDTLNAMDRTTKNNIVSLYRPVIMTDCIDYFNNDDSQINIISNFNLTNVANEFNMCYSEELAFHKSFSDLKIVDLTTWFDLFRAIIFMDLGIHEPDYLSRFHLNKLDQLYQLTDAYQSIFNTKDFINQDNLDFDSIRSHLSTLDSVYNSTKNILDSLNKDLHKTIPINNYFENTIKTAFSLLSEYSKSDPTAPFSEKCIQFCEYLFASGMFRNYEMNDYKNNLDFIVKEKERYYYYRLNTSVDNDGNKCEKSLYYLLNASDSLYMASLTKSIEEAKTIADKNLLLNNLTSKLLNLSEQLLKDGSELKKHFDK